MINNNYFYFYYLFNERKKINHFYLFFCIKLMMFGVKMHLIVMFFFYGLELRFILFKMVWYFVVKYEPVMFFDRFSR